MAEDAKVEWESQVDLVALAVGDPALHLFDTRHVLRLGERRHHFGNAGATPGFRKRGKTLGQPSIKRFRGQRLRLGKTPGAQTARAVGHATQGRIAGCA